MGEGDELSIKTQNLILFKLSASPVRHARTPVADPNCERVGTSFEVGSPAVCSRREKNNVATSLASPETPGLVIFVLVS